MLDRSNRMDLELPRVVVGTSSLGNLFRCVPYEEKRALIDEWIRRLPKPIVLDTAGKYGAGLALEVIGCCLRESRIDRKDVLISNKLAWKRIPLSDTEPTFEPGAWVGITHDAVQEISHDGILECLRQGDELLGDGFSTDFLSVHDADEYLDGAESSDDQATRRDDIFRAYDALAEAKAKGKARGIGAGAKNWRVIKEICERVDLDWVMIANSLTVYRHPAELVEFVEDLSQKGVWVINSAVFHSGFLLGGDYFDYQSVDASTQTGQKLCSWRQRFEEVCRQHRVSPLHACVQFGLATPGVSSVALATGRAARVKGLLNAAETPVPNKLWNDLKDANLISAEFVGD